MNDRLLDVLTFLGVGVFCIVSDLSRPSWWTPGPAAYGAALIVMAGLRWRLSWARWPAVAVWVSLAGWLVYFVLVGTVSALALLAAVACLYEAYRIGLKASQEKVQDPPAFGLDDPDSGICDSTFNRIAEYHGEPLELSKLSEEERTVIAVEGARGLIGNGGFNSLFEGDFATEDYLLTARAFEAIGAVTAAQAFRRALALFPDERPPADMDERLRIFREGDGAVRGELDKAFWDADEEITRRLAEYIRSRPEAFAHLTGPPPKRKRPRRKPASEKTTAEPSGVGVHDLPHWARVAFAARCARRLVPVFKANWPNANEKRLGDLLRAIELAEQSAAQARPVQHLKNARMCAVVTAGAALTTLYGFPNEENEPMPPDGNMATLAHFVAKTAEHAALAAEQPPDKSADAALAAYSFACQAAAKRNDILETFKDDFARLYVLARDEEWSDTTAVAPDI